MLLDEFVVYFVVLIDLCWERSAGQRGAHTNTYTCSAQKENTRASYLHVNILFEDPKGQRATSPAMPPSVNFVIQKVERDMLNHRVDLRAQMYLTSLSRWSIIYQRSTAAENHRNKHMLLWRA